jgi:hypothetical protein
MNPLKAYHIAITTIKIAAIVSVGTTLALIIGIYVI